MPASCQDIPRRMAACDCRRPSPRNTSILVSSADKSIYVIQNGDIVAEGKAEMADPGKKLGSNVFILEKGDEDGFTWQATGYSTGKKAAKPGMVFITTDQLATPDTRSGKDFTVMDSEGK